MGAKQSVQLPKVPHEDSNDARLLGDFDLSAPKAAVIGAGLGGVHAAYELAKLGFQVTVFDKKSDVGCGSSTRFSRPVVGVGSRAPALWDVPLCRDLLYGVLPLGVPDIYSKDSAHITFFSSAIHRWIYARGFGGQASSITNRAAVHQWGQALSAQSADKVRLMCTHHPALAACVSPLEHVLEVPVPRSVDVSSTPEGAIVAPSFPASKTPMLLDTVRWTRLLATICKEQLGVKFRLNTPVRSLTPNFRHGSEFISDIRFLTSDNPGETAKDVVAQRFDIYVLACGAEAANLTFKSIKVPVIDLRGYGVSMPAASSDTFLSGIMGALAMHAPKDLSSFFMDVLPRNSICAFPSLQSPGEVVLSGLYSFDNYSKSPTLRNIVDKFAASVRVHLHREIKEPTAAESSSMVPFHYSRCVSPDGLPIISTAGMLFNCFVCTAFGDQEADWGPAAAQKLSEIVGDVGKLRCKSTSEAEAVATNPYSLSRFPRLYPSAYQVEKPFKFWHDYEKQLDEYGAPQRRKFVKLLNDVARMDGCPLFFRTMVFQYFYEQSESALAVPLNLEENIKLVEEETGRSKN